MQTISSPLHTSLRELSYPARLEIVAALAVGPLTVNELVEQLQIVQPTVSKHLAELRAIGIVSARRDGVRQHYSLNRRGFMEVATQLVDLLSDGGAE